jgi:hypothetical protein
MAWWFVKYRDDFTFTFLLGWVPTASGCRAQLFVRGKLVCLFTVFVLSIEARQPRVSVDRHRS